MVSNLNAASIEQVLRSNVIGRLGCYTRNKPYVIPLTYVYDGSFIYGHTSEGMKTHILENNPNVCFQVDAIRNMTDWESVIVWGVFERLHGDKAVHALQIIVNRLEPYLTSVTSYPRKKGKNRVDLSPSRVVKSVVYRIRISEKVGKFERRV